MKHQEKNSKENLEQALTALRAEQPEAETIQAASERVWQRLQEASTAQSPQLNSIRGCDDVRSLLPQYREGQLSVARVMLVEAHLHECVACRREAETGKRSSSVLLAWQHELPRVTNDHFRWVAATAAIILIAISVYFVQDRFFAGPAGMRARVESFNGILYRVGLDGGQLLKVGDELAEGEKVRTGGSSHAMLRLRDGSLVEMNERAEFGVAMGRRDTTIELGRGNIIVQAAKRKTGHLYVAARDCRVSVTGTVFSVNAGIKGSRVSVIEGEVRVAEAGAEKVLHSGDQLSTNVSVAVVPVREEISWSQNLDKHLALLAEFAHLSNKLETVRMPGLRYQSKVLPALPGTTVLYASIPNLGDAAQQANQLFQQELQESSVLREWWQQVQARKGAANFDEIINYVHDLGQYLGDEIVFSVALDGREGSAIVVAQVQKPGLKQFIQQEFAKHSSSKSSEIYVVDAQELNNMPASKVRHLLVLVRPDFVAASGDVGALQRFNAALDQGGGFAGTPFGQRMAAAYQQGAGLLFGANLQEMASHHAATHPSGHHQQAFEQSGLADVQYLVAERKDSNGQTLNHADLTFNGPRRGVASWLAAPAPIGGLDFVSQDAGIVAAFVSKSPAQMLDDVLNIAYASNPNAEANLAKGESELKIRFHQDLADTLGGEVTFALDGPILPTPSWKIVAEVYDSGRLQSTIQQLVADANEHNKERPEHHVSLEQEAVNGLTYYSLHFQDSAKSVQIDYTFVDGYLIVAPSRSLLLHAIYIHQN